MNLGESPLSLRLSPLESSKEALISLSSEVVLIEVSKSSKRIETVNLYSHPGAGKPPVSCYLPDGSVVIVHAGGGLIYPPGDRLAHCATLSIPADAGEPVDVCPGGKGGFVILTSTGKLVVFNRA